MSETQPAEIKKIVLAFEGKELELSLESAKKLKELLNELFPNITYI